MTHTQRAKLQAIFSYLSLLFGFWQKSMGKATSFHWESKTLTINEGFQAPLERNFLLLIETGGSAQKRWCRVEAFAGNEYFGNSNEHPLSQPVTSTPSNIHPGWNVD